MADTCASCRSGVLRPVVVDLDAVEQMRRRAPGPDRRELRAGRLDRLLHARLPLVEEVIQNVVVHSPGVLTTVPTRSPHTIRSMFPSSSMLKTWIGSELSMQSESAVESITASRCSIASTCVISSRKRACGSYARIGAVDALHAVLGHQQRLGVDLEGAQGGRRVGREERVAGAGGEDHDAALLEVPHRAAADVGLGDLRDRDRRLHARDRAGALERVLERQRVQDRGEHAHVVAGGAVHARRRRP